MFGFVVVFRYVSYLLFVLIAKESKRLDKSEYNNNNLCKAFSLWITTNYTLLYNQMNCFFHVRRRSFHSFLAAELKIQSLDRIPLSNVDISAEDSLQTNDFSDSTQLMLFLSEKTCFELI